MELKGMKAKLVFALLFLFVLGAGVCWAASNDGSYVSVYHDYAPYEYWYPVDANYAPAYYSEYYYLPPRGHLYSRPRYTPPPQGYYVYPRRYALPPRGYYLYPYRRYTTPPRGYYLYPQPYSYPYYQYPENVQPRDPRGPRDPQRQPQYAPRPRSYVPQQPQPRQPEYSAPPPQQRPNDIPDYMPNEFWESRYTALTSQQTQQSVNYESGFIPYDYARERYSDAQPVRRPEPYPYGY